MAHTLISMELEGLPPTGEQAARSTKKHRLGNGRRKQSASFLSIGETSPPTLEQWTSISFTSARTTENGT